MKTKTIPFDLETAKKIQAGEIEGKILNNLKNEVRIVCFDREDAVAPIIALFKVDGGEGVMYVRKDGHAVNCRDILVLEVTDNEPQFKPFDKVLVRKNDDDCQYWQPKIYSFFHPAFKEHVTTDGMMYEVVLPYEGNEHLVGTIDKPKED